MSGKTEKLHNWPKMGSQSLTHNGQLSTSRRTRTVIIFQQQFVFNIEINGSVQLFQKIGNMIRSSDDSKWQACMQETDAYRSWQASDGEPWTSGRDGQGRSNVGHSWLVTALHRKSKGPGDAHVLAHSSERENSDSEGDASRVEKPKRKHSIHTHFPKDRKGSIPRAEEIGDLITAEQKVLNDGSESRNNHRYAVVVHDLATQWMHSFPCKNKNSQETEWSLREFLVPSKRPKVIHTDNSLEFGKSCE